MQQYIEWRSIINDQTADFFNLLQEEHQIPPMFSCLHIGGFCFANIIAAYSKQDMEPPKELVEFMNTTFLKLLEEQKSMITDQFLLLNTEGTA